MTLAPDAALGPYRILAPLGAGGMGEVYRAKDARLDREVAIKVLPKSLETAPEAMARFEREAKIVAALSHPNILAVYDVFLAAFEFENLHGDPRFLDVLRRLNLPFDEPGERRP